MHRPALLLAILWPSLAFADDDMFGKLDIVLLAELGLDKGTETQISVSPDATYRSKRFEVSLYHSARSLTGLHGIGLGGAVCVRGAACETYRGFGLQAYYNVYDKLEIGEGWFNEQHTRIQLGGGPVITSLDDFELKIKAGARISLTSGFGMFELEPHAIFGAAGRDTFEDSIFVPVRISLMTIIGIESGFASPIEDLGDRWQAPISFYGRFPIYDQLLIVGAFTFSAAFGAEEVDTGTTQRAATIGLEYMSW